MTLAPVQQFIAYLTSIDPAACVGVNDPQPGHMRDMIWSDEPYARWLDSLTGGRHECRSVEGWKRGEYYITVGSAMYVPGQWFDYYLEALRRRTKRGNLTAAQTLTLVSNAIETATPASVS